MGLSSDEKCSFGSACLRVSKPERERERGGGGGGLRRVKELCEGVCCKISRDKCPVNFIMLPLFITAWYKM